MDDCSVVACDRFARVSRIRVHVHWEKDPASKSYIGRRTLPRKVLFLMVGTASGYATLLLLNWGMVVLLTQLAVISESTGEFAIFLMVYLPILLALSIPVLVVFGVFRHFSSISQRDAR